MSEIDTQRSTPAPLAHAGLLAVMLAIAAFVGRGLALGPVPLLVAVALYLELTQLIPALRRTRPPLRVGTPTRGTLALAAVTAIGSVVALVLWLKLAQPDLSDLKSLVPRLEGAPLIALGCAFALLNAAGEEIVFRGIAQPALEAELGKTLGLISQAIVFGAVHTQTGFPRGAVGFALVSVYGLSLGLLCRFSRGLALPWGVHVIADATIFALVTNS